MTDSAVEAAAAATFDVYRCGNCGDGMCPICMTMRRAMYAAAMPAIREAIANELHAALCTDPNCEDVCVGAANTVEVVLEGFEL